MEIAKLILEFLKALIWPITVILLAWVFKREIRAVLARIRKAVLPGGVSMDFEDQIIETKALATRVGTAEKPPNRPQSVLLPLTEANSRMIRSGPTPAPGGLDTDYYKKIATRDPTLALAGLRIALEVLLKNVAKGFKISISGPESATRLLQLLRDSGAMTPNQLALAQKILSLTDQAVHGRTVSQHESVEIIDAAKALFDSVVRGNAMIRTITTFRNPIAAIWQHAIHKAVSQRQPGKQLYLSATQPEMTQFNAAVIALQSGQRIPPVDSLGNVVGDCAKAAAEYVWAEITQNAKRASELENELRDSKCDPLWSIALAIYLAWKESLDPIPYVRYASLDDFVIPLPDRPDLVIGVIADWGTGLDDARWLLSEVMKKNPDVLLHLGDVYYAGTADEFRQNFLDLINAIAPNIPVYALSGNHDMYAGGGPFYWVLTQLNASSALQPYQQKASYFCLRSANWQILGMDTGLHDCDPFSVTTNVTFLDPKEAAWHVDKLNNAGGRQTILLSHHPLFTAFLDGIGQGPSRKPLAYNPKLYSVFGPFLNNIALWLWGHEHNFEVFNPYLGLQKGRCVGAAAIPCLEAENPYGLIQNPDLQGQSALPSLAPGVMELAVNSDGWYFHNYAILTLRSPKSQFRDSKIEYYELDSSKQGPSILMHGENIP